MGLFLNKRNLLKFLKITPQKTKRFLKPQRAKEGWHEDVNEVILFAKEFSDNFDSYFIGVEHILYVILDMEGSFIVHLRQNGIDPLHAKDVIETHVLENSIPPTDQIKNILHIGSKKNLSFHEEGAQQFTKSSEQVLH